MTVKVPMTDIGSVRLGMIVAERFRRNRKITSTTSVSVSSSVNCTSLAELLIETLLSRRTSSLTEAGRFSRKPGSSAFTASATSMVFVPGWRWMARMMDRSRLPPTVYQAATWSFSTLSTAVPTSQRRTGWPLR